jgi:hypothetical protein
VSPGGTSASRPYELLALWDEAQEPWHRPLVGAMAMPLFRQRLTLQSSEAWLERLDTGESDVVKRLGGQDP